MQQLLLDKNEEVVYTLISEFLKSKRAITLEKLLPYLKKKIHKSRLKPNQIQEILDKFINKNIIVEGSQLIKEELFNVPKRWDIYQYIVNNPGVYAYQITRDLNFSSNVILWHLKILNDFNLIEEEKIENHTIFFDSKIDIFEAKRHYYLRKKKIQQILDFLGSYDNNITKTRISKELNIHINTITKHLEALQEIGSIFARIVENRKIYRIVK